MKKLNSLTCFVANLNSVINKGLNYVLDLFFYSIIIVFKKVLSIYYIQYLFNKTKTLVIALLSASPAQLAKYARKITALILAITMLCTQNAYSLPQNVEVVEGTAEVSVTDNIMTINAGSGTILNYASFDIAPNEAVIVNLPDASSQILNRVLGDTASNLAGSLSCNGLFILINTNGIFVASTANINVGSIVLSTRDITNENFLSGNYLFEKISSEQLDSLLLNAGTINISEGGFGVMIAGAIENEGIIIAPIGRIELACGDAVKLDISKGGLISVAIEEAVASTILDKEGNPITDQLKNTGNIEADGGTVVLSAESLPDIFKKAVNLEGHISANTIEKHDGLIKIVANGDVRLAGELEATKVEVGDELTPIGGDVTIEGGYIKADESILNAEKVRLEGAGHDYLYTIEHFLEAEELGVMGTDTHYFYGDMTIYNFECTTPFKHIYFEPGKTYTFKDSVNVAVGNEYHASVMMLSQEEGSPWYIDVDTDDYTFKKVAVRDGHNIGESDIYVSPSSNWGNNVGWDFNTHYWEMWRETFMLSRTGYWSYCYNWTTGLVPTVLDDVVFTGHFVPGETYGTDLWRLNASAIVDYDNHGGPFYGEIASLTIASDYIGTITLETTLTVGTYTQNGSEFYQNGYDMHVSGSMAINGGCFLQSGTPTKSGTLTIGDSLSISGGQLYQQYGIMELTGDGSYIEITGGGGLTQSEYSSITINGNGGRIIIGSGSMLDQGYGSGIYLNSQNAALIVSGGTLHHGGNIEISGMYGRFEQYAGRTNSYGTMDISGQYGSFCLYDGTFYQYPGATLEFSSPMHTYFQMWGGTFNQFENFLAPADVEMWGGEFNQFGDVSIPGILSQYGGTYNQHALLEIDDFEHYGGEFNQYGMGETDKMTVGNFYLHSGFFNQNGSMEIEYYYQSGWDFYQNGTLAVLSSFTLDGGLFFQDSLGITELTCPLAVIDGEFYQRGDLILNGNDLNIHSSGGRFFNYGNMQDVNDLNMYDGNFYYEPGANFGVTGKFHMEGGTFYQNADLIMQGDYEQIGGEFLAGSLLTVQGDFTCSGAAVFTHNNGTVAWTPMVSGATLEMSSGSSFYDLQIDGNDNSAYLNSDFTVDNNLYVDNVGDFTFSIEAQGGDRNIYVSGDAYLHSGSDRGIVLGGGANSLTMNLDGTYYNSSDTSERIDSSLLNLNLANSAVDSYIYGSNIFGNLTCNTPGKNIYFESGETQTVENAFTIQGASGNPIHLESDVPGSRWNLDVNGAASVDYAIVQDSNNISPFIIKPTNSASGGNNMRWEFPFTLSGYIYEDWEELSLFGSGFTVGLIANGTVYGTTVTVDGYYEFIGVPYSPSGSWLLYIEDAQKQGNAVVTGCSEGIGQLNLYNDTVVVKSYDSSSYITNSTFSAAKGGLTSNDIRFDFPGSGIRFSSGLLIAENTTYEPGGDVGIGVSTQLPYGNRGTLRLEGSESINIYSDSGTVIYYGTGSYADLAAGDNYNNLVFEGSGSWIINDSLNVSNDFTLTDGNITQANDVAIGGNYAQTGGTFTSIDPQNDTFSVGGDFSIPDTAGAFRRHTNAGEIYDIYGLQAMKCWLDKDFTLANDIDASVVSSWNGGTGFDPVGNAGSAFQGTFDGQRHEIAGLFINRANESYVGLFGYTDGASLSNVGIVDAAIHGGGGMMGGTGALVGRSNITTITNSYSTGTVTGGGSVGGLIGYHYYGDKSYSVQNCYSEANVTGAGDFVGGLIGLSNDDDTKIFNSYATGNVIGGDKVGGFGGIIYGVTENCYSTGTVSGGNSGGLLGTYYGSSRGSAVNSYWNIETSGKTTSGGGEGKTTQEMMQESTFSGWDFDDTWAIEEGGTYPYLKAFYPQGALGVFGEAYSDNTPVAGEELVGVDITLRDNFIAGLSAVEFYSLGISMITGSSTFNNLTCVTGGKTLIFGAGETQETISLSLSGSEGNPIAIESGTEGVAAEIKVAQANASYISVKDSNNTGTIIDASSSTDLGNNDGYNINES